MYNFNEKQQEMFEALKQERFYTINRSGKSDTFMRGWVSLISASQQKMGRFNRKKIEKAYASGISDFKLMEYAQATDEEKAVYDAHYEEFARKLIDISRTDRNYAAMFGGILHLDAASVKRKLQAEIDVVTREFPSKFEQTELFLPLRKQLLLFLDAVDTAKEENAQN